VLSFTLRPPFPQKEPSIITGLRAGWKWVGLRLSVSYVI
jgi:hypothetical protein